MRNTEAGRSKTAYELPASTLRSLGRAFRKLPPEVEGGIVCLLRRLRRSGRSLTAEEERLLFVEVIRVAFDQRNESEKAAALDRLTAAVRRILVGT